jgi:hypothetical protein
MHCERCGERLSRFESEIFYTDCDYYAALEQLEQATDEALAELAIDHPDDAMDWHSEPPF